MCNFVTPFQFCKCPPLLLLPVLTQPPLLLRLQMQIRLASMTSLEEFAHKCGCDDEYQAIEILAAVNGSGYKEYLDGFSSSILPSSVLAGTALSFIAHTNVLEDRSAAINFSFAACMFLFNIVVGSFLLDNLKRKQFYEGSRAAMELYKLPRYSNMRWACRFSSIIGVLLMCIGVARFIRLAGNNLICVEIVWYGIILLCSACAFPFVKEELKEKCCKNGGNGTKEERTCCKRTCCL